MNYQAFHAKGCNECIMSLLHRLDACKCTPSHSLQIAIPYVDHCVLPFRFVGCMMWRPFAACIRWGRLVYAQCFARAFSLADPDAKRQAGLFSKGLYRLLKLKKQAEKGRIPRSQELLELAKLISDDQPLDQEVDETPAGEQQNVQPATQLEEEALRARVQCIEKMMTFIKTHPGRYWWPTL